MRDKSKAKVDAINSNDYGPESMKVTSCVPSHHQTNRMSVSKHKLPIPGFDYSGPVQTESLEPL